MPNQKAPLGLLFLTIFIDLMGFGLVIPILPNYIKELAGSEYWVGFAIATFSLMQFLASPVLGSLSDKYGRRPILIFTIALNIIGYGLLAIANTLPLIFLARAINGLASGNISVAQAYIIDVTPVERRSKAMGLIGAAFGLGFIFGPPLGGILMAKFGFWSIGAFSAILCILNLIPAIFLLKESLPQLNKQAIIRFLPISDFKEVFKTPHIWKLFIINFIYITAFFLFQVVSALFWEEHFGLTAEERGYTYAFLGLSTALVQGGMVGALSKRFGDKLLLIVGNIAMAVILVALGLVPAPLFLLLEIPLIFVMALANGPVGPATLSLLSQKVDAKEQGKVVGLYQSFGSLARVVGPLIGTSLYAQNYVLPFIGAGIMLVCNAFFAKSAIKGWRSEA